MVSGGDPDAFVWLWSKKGKAKCANMFSFFFLSVDPWAHDGLLWLNADSWGFMSYSYRSYCQSLNVVLKLWLFGCLAMHVVFVQTFAPQKLKIIDTKIFAHSSHPIFWGQCVVWPMTYWKKSKSGRSGFMQVQLTVSKCRAVCVDFSQNWDVIHKHFRLVRFYCLNRCHISFVKQVDVFPTRFRNSNCVLHNKHLTLHYSCSFWGKHILFFFFVRNTHVFQTVFATHADYILQKKTCQWIVSRHGKIC